MDVFRNKSVWGYIGTIGNMHIFKLKCRKEIFESFKYNATVSIKVNRGEVFIDEMYSFSKRLKSGKIGNYTVFKLMCTDQINNLRHINAIEKRIQILMEELSQLQLDLGMLR